MKLTLVNFKLDEVRREKKSIMMARGPGVVIQLQPSWTTIEAVVIDVAVVLVVALVLQHLLPEPQH